MQRIPLSPGGEMIARRKPVAFLIIATIVGEDEIVG
jgi:hypothetical protein